MYQPYVKGHKQLQQREFNGFNQLISLHNGQNLTRYEYDALGRRSAKITAAGRIDYLWDGNQLIGEHCQDRFTWYLYEPAGNSSQSYRPFALIVQGEVYYYQLDQLGTPFALLDQHNHLVWQASYSALGQATVSVNVIANPLRFQGQYYDEESGLHYNHFRYYDPQTGRFISQDPIGLLGGLNHYQYAPNHINWIDPLGLCAKEDASVGLLDGIVGTADLVITGLLNTGVDIVAGGAGLVTLAISGGDLDAAVHTIESVQEKQLGLLTQAGDKVANVVAPVVDKYYEQNMAALGEVTLETTGLPALAMMAHKSVEIAGTLLGGRGVIKGVKGAKPTPGSFSRFVDTVEEFKAAPELAEKSFHLFTEGKWNDLETLFKENKLNHGWPPNRGAISTEKITLEKGNVIDRYGGFFDEDTGQFRDLGTFTAKAGEPFENRALPLATLDKPYNQYEVLKDIPDVEAGQAIPWFGQTGKGMQYELPLSVDELVEHGYLKRIGK
ncbi:RHS repeat-associated core domain-containing protein [Shewanella baltica]|uniref:RHS repeat-associated core domain-containing protein n=1 Tax=Shewanella baltica TaxID=62322 RepID=UPI002877C1BD|nr:RHS repeat-associated core domain-containing protein [Shewanella baltica]MCS6123647.1 glycohydrolase toxin TNT-related protein [Shewanella baltica]